MKSVRSEIIVAAGFALALVALFILFGTGPRYKSLTQEDAAKVMAANDDCLIVDVRTENEYAGGHIPDAINVPLDRIEAGDVADALPDKRQVLLIYCYAGRRSVEAAKALAAMGYTEAYEFGGIVDWSGEVVTEEN